MPYGFSTEEVADEFYGKLNELLNSYEQHIARADLDAALPDGFVPDEPSIRTGIIIMVTERKLTGDWQTSWRSYMPGTNHWHVRGMADDYLAWISEH